MIKKIDIFWPCEDAGQLQGVIDALQRENAVKNITMLERQPVQQMATLRRIAEEATADYVLISQKTTPAVLGQQALDRMLRVAVETAAVMLYADHYDEKTAEDGTRVVEKHPLIDCQEGAIRDDFDFGQLLLIRTSYLKEFVKQQKNDYAYAALYALRLYLQRYGELFHLNEYLYTEVELDNRKSGEKQFDYVNPRNRSVQIEMEHAATEHLEQVGAKVDTSVRLELDFNEQVFSVEASVVIPVYNRAKTIADAVKSALEQTPTFKFNVIVVDNHSTDGTTEAVDDSEEFLDVLVGHTAADIDGNEQACAVGILATHRIKAVAAVGTHAREVALGTQDAGTELAEDGAEVLLAHQCALDQGSQVATQ